MNQIGEVKEGKLLFDKDRMKQMLGIMEDGRYLITFLKLNPLSDVKDYRAAYFAKIDTLCKEAGETRYDMHEHVKSSILEDMIKETPDAFESPEATTKALTLDGWRILMESLDIWAFVTYNVIL